MKRRKNFVKIEDKIQAVELCNAGQSTASVAEKYQVDRSTLAKWKRNYTELKESSKYFTGKKNKRREDFPQTSEALSLWFFNMRDKGIPIHGYLIQEKAKEFHEVFKDGPENFAASRGWLHKWKKKHGIRQLTVSGESLSSREDELPQFMEQLQQIVSENDLTCEQLYNADETGLCYRKLPNKTLVEKQRKSAPGYKVNKERLTALACANASGSHKLPLFVIGKSAKPRCFKNTTLELPVKYASQSSSWMTKELFREWFFKDAVPQIEAHLKEQGLPPKAVLVLDNAPVHPPAEELVSGGIQVLYLPPNCTATIQPMDQNVLETMKKKYRRIFLRFLLRELEKGEDLMTSIKKVHVLKAIYWLSEAWDDTESRTIAKSWKGLLDNTSTPSDQDDSTVQEGEINETEELNEFCQLLGNFPASSEILQHDIQEWFADHMELNNEEIIGIVRDTYEDHQNENFPNESSIDENSSFSSSIRDEADQNISYEEGIAIFEKALMFAKQEKLCESRIAILQEIKNETELKLLEFQ